MSVIPTVNPLPDTRQRLLDAGTRLFAEHGFKGVSIRDLSALAGTNIAAINYHFGGKQGLYQAIFTATLEADEARFQETLKTIRTLANESRGHAGQLAAAVRLYVQNLLGPLTADERTRWFAVLAIREMAFPTDAFEQLYRRRADPSQSALLCIVAAARGVAPRAITETEALEAHALTGMIMAFGIARAILWRRMQWDDYTPERIRRIAEVLANLICRTLDIDIDTPDSDIAPAGISEPTGSANRPS